MADSTPPGAPKPPPAPPKGLSPRGRALWTAMHQGRTPGPTETVLLVEACRLVDRLDRLDLVLRGSPFVTLRTDEDDEERLVLVVDSAASEARMTAGALKQIVAELRHHGGGEGAGQGGSLLDQLAAKRADRIANSSG